MSPPATRAAELHAARPLVGTSEKLRIDVTREQMLATSRVVLVGEHNPYSANPWHCLYPLPATSAGGRLAKILGMTTPRDYLRAFHRHNLVAHDEHWSVALARLRARSIEERYPAGDFVLALLGARVAAAFAAPGEVLRPFDKICIYLPDPLHGARAVPRFVTLPHPSGRNRAWNEPGAAAAAAALIRSVMAP